MSPPKPKRVDVPNESDAAKIQAEVQNRLKSQKGYAATFLRGSNSLMGDYLKQQTGAA